MLMVSLMILFLRLVICGLGGILSHSPPPSPSLSPRRMPSRYLDRPITSFKATGGSGCVFDLDWWHQPVSPTHPLRIDLSTLARPHSLALQLLFLQATSIDTTPSHHLSPSLHALPSPAPHLNISLNLTSPPRYPQNDGHAGIIVAGGADGFLRMFTIGQGLRRHLIQTIVAANESKSSEKIVYCISYDGPDVFVFVGIFFISLPCVTCCRWRRAPGQRQSYYDTANSRTKKVSK